MRTRSKSTLRDTPTSSNMPGNLDTSNGLDGPSKQFKAQDKKQIAAHAFALGEIVWGKLKGFRHWPGKIIGISKNKFVLSWYNDPRISIVAVTQLYSFSKFALKFSNNVSTALKKAIKEALIEMRFKKT